MKRLLITLIICIATISDAISQVNSITVRSQISQTLPDNSSRAISPLLVRNALNKIVDLVDLKFTVVSSVSELQQLESSSYGFYNGAIWQKMSGNFASNGDDIINVSSTVYWKKITLSAAQTKALTDASTTLSNTAISTANTATITANSAVSIANTATLQGVRLGAWNASTNTPTLTNDASAVTLGGFYDVTVSGASTFAGQNFSIGQLFSVGERIARIDTTWYRIPYSIPEKSIGIAQTNFIEKVIGKNKFNQLNATDNFYIDETGTVYANSVYCYSDFIPVESSTQYYGTNGTNGMRFIAFYDANKNIVTGGSDSMINLFTTGSTTKYIRITIFKADKNTFQLVRGVATEVYEPYTEKNLLQQITLSDNTIETGLIKDGAITPNKTDFLKLGKNKFNVLTATDNFYLSETGVLGASGTYAYSDFIPVKPSTQYYGSGNGLGMRFIAFYDANKNIVTGGIDAGSITNTFTTTSSTYFARITLFKSAKLNFQLEEGAMATDFERYGYKFDKITINTTESKPVEIAIAPVLYTLNNNELAVYYDNIHKDAKTFEGKSEISGTYGKQTGESTKFTPTSTGTSSVLIATANDDFDVVNTTTSTVVSVNPTNTTAVKILNVGDSYTYSRTFTSKLSAISSNITFLGIRTNPTLSIQCEGRGGYTLSNYFTLQKGSVLFSPFMQPSGLYKYYGVTGFWKLANVTTPDYEHANYGTVKGLFNASTGYKISPATNDVMYDDTAGAFYVYNGSVWVTISESTLAFTFNFAKYRSVWGVAMPDIIHIHLGTNEWYAGSSYDIRTDWPAWKTNLDTFITSVKADNANVKIIVGIPNASGKQGGIGILTTEKSNRNYWIHAKNIITNYSNRESEKIYVADYHSIIDRQYAFDVSNEVPYAEYTGAFRNKYMADFTHLSVDGYNQMGNMYGALIQFLR